MLGRSDRYILFNRINTKEIINISRMVSSISGMSVQANKAVVGANAFAHEAGIHQHGMLSDQRTYEIMRPEDVGLSNSKIVLGKHSGRSALRNRLDSMGYALKENEVEKVFQGFKALADKKEKIFDEDLHALVAGEVFRIPAMFGLESLSFNSGSHTTPNAEVVVTVNGENRTAKSTGDGPVHAAIEAIKSCTGKQKSVLKEYHLDSITGGSDAQGRVRLSVAENGLMSRGRAAHTDVVVASAMAFIDALNHQEYRKEIDQRRAMFCGVGK